METEITILLVIGVLICLFQTYNSEQICVSCTDVGENETCHNIESCKNNEVCFVQKYRTLHDEIKYDVGCTDPELCQKDPTGNLVGKRSDHSHVLCQKCCNDGQICNKDKTCNAILQVLVPRQKCLTCSMVEHPDLCSNNTVCEQNEICFVHKYDIGNGKHHYDLGCKHSTLCLHGSITNAFGRRSGSSRHLICESCCSGNEICNINLDCNQENQKMFNSTCSGTHECGSNLVCLSSRCQCFSEGYYMYWENNACVRSKALNEACTTTNQCKHPLQCIGNICKCPPLQYWNSLTCTREKSYNERCNTSVECNNSLFCNLGRCTCDRTNYWSGTTCVQRKSYNFTCKTTEKCEDSLLRCIDGKCACISSEYWTGNTCAKPKECEDIDSQKDGVYTIYPTGSEKSVSVYCIMRANKKWTVIQQRFNFNLSFDRGWSEYKNGFGFATGDYWLGNDNIHAISTNGHHEISIYLWESQQKFGYANYSTFNVENESNKYRLNITGYSGNTNDAMDKGYNLNGPANGMSFTTKGNDNDRNSENCAILYGGGWWYNSCFHGNLNMKNDVYWQPFSVNLKKIIMMIRKT